MTPKMLIKHSFRGLVDPANTGRVFAVSLRSAVPDWREVIENEGWDWTSFLGQRRLCSHVTKTDVKWSDNALTKPVIRACLLSTWKISTYNERRQHALGKVGFFLQKQFSVLWNCGGSLKNHPFEMDQYDISNLCSAAERVVLYSSVSS